MESQRYLVIGRRFLPLIVLVAMVSGGSSAVFSRWQATVYRATVTLLINPAAPSAAIPFLSQSTTTDPRAETQQLADNYDVYLKTATFDAKVVHELGLALAPSALGSALSSALIGDTNFYTISATAGTGREAALIANGVATLFIKQSLALRQTLEGRAADLNLQITATKNELASVRRLDQSLIARPVLAPQDQQTLASIEARMNYLTDIYTTLLTEAATGTRQLLPTATVVEAASVPAQPIGPQLHRAVLVGSAAGLAIGVVLALLLDFLTASLVTAGDIERVTGMAPLAVIGAAGTQVRPTRSGTHTTLPKPAGSAARPVFAFARGRTGRSRQGLLVTLENPRDPVTEAFRALRTTLLFSNAGPAPRSVVVTSMLPGEGKTLVAANLAIVLAQSGLRVILVDADLRQPTLHTIFGLAASTGLSDLLLGSTMFSAVLQQTAVPGLRLLPCGPVPSNPAELLSFPTAATLVQDLAAACDLLIFDTPPMGLLTDAVVLSARAEGTLVVVRAGSTSPQLLARGLGSLQAVGARPLGTVLNMADMPSQGTRGHLSHMHLVGAR